MDWSVHYPSFKINDTAQLQENGEASNNAHSLAATPKLRKQVEVADIGCGFGGLLFALAPKMPDTLIMGMPQKQRPTSYNRRANTRQQAWRFVFLSRSTFRTRFELCASSKSTPAQPLTSQSHLRRPKTMIHLMLHQLELHRRQHLQKHYHQQIQLHHLRKCPEHTKTSLSFAPTP